MPKKMQHIKMEGGRPIGRPRVRRQTKLGGKDLRMMVMTVQYTKKDNMRILQLQCNAKNKEGYFLCLYVEGGYIYALHQSSYIQRNIDVYVQFTFNAIQSVKTCVYTRISLMLQILLSLSLSLSHTHTLFLSVYIYRYIQEGWELSYGKYFPPLI